MKILMVNDPLSLHEAACIKVIMLSVPRSYINHLTLFRHINSRKKRPTQWQSVQTRGHNSVCVVLCVYRLYGVLRPGGVDCVWSWTKCITTNFPHRHRHRQCLGLGLCILRSSGYWLKTEHWNRCLRFLRYAVMLVFWATVLWFQTWMRTVLLFCSLNQATIQSHHI